MKQCKHPTCGDSCRRLKLQTNKAYTLTRTPLKRTPIKRKPYKIKKVSKKRKEQNKIYSDLRLKFLEQNPECEIQAPGCTCEATTIHHLEGRENERLNDVTKWKASCVWCNGYVETHSSWAYQTGNKLYKHQINISNDEQHTTTNTDT